MTKFDPIKGSLGSYQVIETLDGSTTLFSEAYQEACHSDQGAYEETLFNYVKGNKVSIRFSELDKGEVFSIFEVGFATGLGLKVTLESLLKDSLKEETKNNNHRAASLRFVSTEIDRELTLFTLNKLKEDGIISSFHEHKEGLNFFTCPLIDILGELIVLVGNARETVPLWRESQNFKKVDAIYQDAFSPKRNPELWTTEWFQELALISHEHSTLTTYSATKAVWKAMMASDWKVKAVKGFKNKKLSTRAYRQGESATDVLDWCERSPTPALSDGSLS